MVDLDRNAARPAKRRMVVAKPAKPIGVVSYESVLDE
jgi:hypothetical protein